MSDQVNSLIAYGDYTELCAGPDDDFVYRIIDYSGYGTELLGSWESLQNQVPNDVLRVNTETVNGLTNSFEIIVGWEDAWDDDNYPEPTSLQEAQFFGFINNNWPDGTVVRIDYFESNAQLLANSPADDFSFTVDGDFWLDNYLTKNDYFFHNNTYQDPIEYIRIIVTFPSAPTYFQLGRLYIGKKMDMVVSNTEHQAFDADWAITLQTEGFSDRNLDESSGVAVCRPQQRLLSFNKSHLNFEAAFGITGGAVNANMYNTPSMFKIGTETARCRDIIAVPDSRSQQHMKFTAVYGTVENEMRIQKDGGGYWNASMDIKELVAETKK